MPEFIRRKNRLEGYDYAADGDYFVTICSEHKKCLFGWIPENTSSVCLSPRGKIVYDMIERLPSVFPCVRIPLYVIMPNHVHLIFRLTGSKRSLSEIVNWLKGSVTKAAGGSVWQKSFYDHIIRDDEDYYRISEYIRYNPIVWSSDIYFLTDDMPEPEYR